MIASTLGSAASGIPFVATSLVGRDDQVARIRSLISEERARLVTIFGPGGVGKTRIAIRIAEVMESEFAEGVVYVSFTSVRHADLVASTIAEAIEVQETSGRPLRDQIAGHIGTREFLLILDNIEQVIDAAPLFPFLLQACPNLVIVVTSRAALRVTGERIVPIPPLALPNPDDTSDLIAQSPAVRLFAERASSLDSAFTIGPHNAQEVARFCAHLDGLPLAIELAAGQTAHHSASSLVSRFARNLLTIEGEDDNPNALRQQTMWQTTAWSYDLLTSEEQLLLRRLSVFTGGFTLEVAEEVCTYDGRIDALDVLDLVSSLIDQSLVQRMEEQAGAPRARLLETIAEFGLAQLREHGEEADTRDAHAAWYLQFAERAEPELKGLNQDTWVTRIDVELGNIRAATTWMTSPDNPRASVHDALRIAGALGWYWSSLGHFHEGLDLFRTLLAMPETNEDQEARAKVLESAGDICNWLGDQIAARTYLKAALAIHQHRADPSRVAALTRGLANIDIDEEHYAHAAVILTEILPHLQDDRWEFAAATNLLGVAHFGLGNHDEAIASAQTAIGIWRDLGDTGHVMTGLTSLGTFTLGHGDRDLSQRCFHEALALTDAANDLWYWSMCVAGIGGCAVLSKDMAMAARLLGAGITRAIQIGMPMRPSTRDLFDRLTRTVRDAFGPAHFDHEWAAGSAMAHDDITAIANEYLAQSSVAQVTPQQSLSSREREVLQLMVQGLTDRQIATELFIERRTVSKHVESILGKLGVHSRTAAGTVALRLGLIDS